MRGPRLSRVSRAIGVAFDNPESISGLSGWFKANTINQANNSTVASWADSSAAGTIGQLTQATEANKPIYKTSAINNLPSVEFVSADWLRSAALTLNQPCTIITVLNLLAYPPTLASSFILDGATNASIGYLLTSLGTWGLFSGSTLGGGSAPLATPSIMVCLFNNPSNSKLWHSGGSAIIDGNSGPNNFSAVTLGAAGSNDGQSPLNGQISEMLFYNSALDLPKINSIGSYLGTKYAISWTTAI